MAKITVEQHNEKAVFVGVIKQGDDERLIMEYLDELEFLAETAGAVGVKKFIQRVDRPDSRTYRSRKFGCEGCRSGSGNRGSRGCRRSRSDENYRSRS